MRHRTIVSGLAAAGVLAAAVLAAPGGDTYTDPATAPVDYQIQGEYTGKAGDQKLGAQVIALGNGTFRAVFLPGGLPGAGWSQGGRMPVEGKLDGSITRFGKEGSGWSGTLADGVLTGQTDRGEKFRLKKVERKSKTLGQKPPKGALVLFDGKSAEHWLNGQVTPEGWLKMGTRTRRDDFQNFTLHFEFRTPFQPTARGQGRGNSGLFIQNRYEVQILDSFGLPEESHECAALYNQKAPDVNMSFPPLTWQTYDIDFETAQFEGKKTKNAVITVRHNGVVVHDRFELPGPGPVGKKEDATGGFFSVQDHGNPVVFRNVWVVER